MRPRRRAISSFFGALVLVSLAVVVVAFPLAVGASSAGGPPDPCDAYGNCLSSSLTYLRSNPGGTLYPGDSFAVQLFIISGQNTTGRSVYWSYDAAVFTRSGDTFTVTGNTTGSFTIGITAVFTVSMKSGNTTTKFTSALHTSQTVVVIPLRLTVSPIQVVNMTDRYGNVLRNPDGSFYRNDSFCVRWSVSFPYSDYRSDIRVNASLSSSVLRLLNASSTTATGRAGLSCYSVRPGASYGPAGLVVNFNAINWMGVSIAHSVRLVPFAVVKYDPHFTYFVYMLYNSRPPSTYQRPFVILVRYDYNSPGFSYGGDNNTAQILLPVDKRERAVLNNFTFTTEGWKVTVSLNAPQVASAFRFIDVGRVNAVYRPLNRSSAAVFTTGLNRVQKYYFIGNLSGSSSSSFYPYYNVTISAYSNDFAGSYRTALFNASYLYEPVKYDGVLAFRFYNNQLGGPPDTTANVTITAHNPSPINVYLVGVVKARFGNDPAVLRAFSRDLYPSNYTQELKQEVRNTNGTIVYLVNQTNYALLPPSPGAALPWFAVTISSQNLGLSFSYSPNPPFLTNEQVLSCLPPSYIFWNVIPNVASCNSISYIVSNHFGLALVNRTAIPSLPFGNVSSYFTVRTNDVLALPLNSTVDGYYVNWVSAPPPNVGTPVLDPIDPLTQEPGGLMHEYQMIYGGTANVFVNTDGGGIAVTGRPQPLQGGSYYYTLSFTVYPQSGGIVHLTITSDQGENLLDLRFDQGGGNSSFTPQGFVGPLQVTIGTGGVRNSVTATFTNAWGARTVISGIQVQPPPAQPLEFPWGLVSIVLLTLFGLYFLQLAIRKRNRAVQP